MAGGVEGISRGIAEGVGFTADMPGRDADRVSSSDRVGHPTWHPSPTGHPAGLARSGSRQPG